MNTIKEDAEKKSGEQLLKLKNNRHVDDIPLNDPYWEALKKHNELYGIGLDKK